MRITKAGTIEAITSALKKKEEILIIFENVEILAYINIIRWLWSRNTLEFEGRALDIVFWDNGAGKDKIYNFFGKGIIFVPIFEQDDKALDCVSILKNNKEKY